MTKKHQMAFYAEPDVDAFLQTVDSGRKTETINTAIRMLMEEVKRADNDDWNKLGKLNYVPRNQRDVVLYRRMESLEATVRQMQQDKRLGV